MKPKEVTKKTKPTHLWRELSKRTLFSVKALEVLSEHYSSLRRYCADPGSRLSTPGGGQATVSASDSTQLVLSFEQYCLCLQTLIKFGSPIQQFDYLFQAYAADSDRGISRSELFQLLKEHYDPSERSTTASVTTARTVERSSSNDKPISTDERYFERLYTWLKKHMTLYDKARSGFLPYKVALDMLETHPTALSHLQLNIDPFVVKLAEQCREKAQTLVLEAFQSLSTSLSNLSS